MIRDLRFRTRLIARALRLRHATQPPPALTWTRDQLQHATARNHRAVVSAQPFQLAQPGTTIHCQLADKEAEP